MKLYLLILFSLLVAASMVLLNVWIYDWDWRCAIVQCRIMK